MTQGNKNMDRSRKNNSFTEKKALEVERATNILKLLISVDSLSSNHPHTCYGTECRMVEVSATEMEQSCNFRRNEGQDPILKKG